MFARLIAALVLLVVLIAAAITAWPQVFGLEQAAGIAHIVSMRGLAAAVAVTGAVLLVLLGLFARRTRRMAGSLIAILVVFALVNAGVLALRGLGGAEVAERGADDVTVLAWNTLGDMPGAAAIAELATEVGADVISLPETTEQTGIDVALLLRQAGNPMWVHTIAYDTVAKARSTTLLIAPRLGAYTFDEAAYTTRVLPTVVATPVDGAGPTIVAVHAVAPIPGQMANWRDDLAWLAEVCGQDDLIIAGDFNATLDHMSSLADEGAHLGGCTDAAAATANGAAGTWPTWAPSLLGAPIDHVMSTGRWEATSSRVVTDRDGSGSDHRPVVVTLSPRAAARAQ